MTTRARVNAVVGFCVLASASVTTLAASGGIKNKERCTDGEVEFRGQCVSQDECCREDLCPTGTVLEFVKEPKCVPCAEAQTQSGASYCAAQDMGGADKELNSVYGSIIEAFPKQRDRLKEAERAWIVFRDKFCAALAGYYEGGSVERELIGRCKADETRRQIQRLEELRKEWSSTAASRPKTSPEQGRSGAK